MRFVIQRVTESEVKEIQYRDSIKTKYCIDKNIQLLRLDYTVFKNKEYIKKSKKVYIFEAEKSVLQCDSFGIHDCVSLGGNQISTTQVEQLLKLGVSEIVLCMDEGLMKDAIIRDIKKIKSMLFMRDVKIKVMIDKENKYLPKGSKCSPSDRGKEIFKKLCNECIIGG